MCKMQDKSFNEDLNHAKQIFVKPENKNDTLNLHRKNLFLFPSSMINENTRILFLDYNTITAIPSIIGNFVNLKILYLSGNKISKLPSSIGNLHNLHELYLDHNQLKSLPKTVSNLKNLTVLYLQNNRLVSLPSLITLSNIQEIRLDNNNIKVLPMDLRNLRNIKLISVNNNNLMERGGRLGIGKIEAIVLFGDRISINSGALEIIDEKTVFEKLKKQKLQWNLDKLSECKNKKTEYDEYDENVLYDILNQFYHKNLLSQECYKILRSYIQKLNHPEIKYNGWAMHDEFSKTTNDILGSILNDLNQRMINGDVEWTDFVLKTICNAVKYFCPDRQISEMKLMFHILKNTSIDEECLTSFIKKSIFMEKERVFEFIFTPFYSNQNVHIHNYWKYTLREILGFDFNFDFHCYSRSEDPFGGHTGNALEAFFIKFTPEYMIDLLTSLINENKKIMCELMAKIASDDDLSVKEKIDMGLDDEYFRCNQISAKAVEYILLKEGIIKRSCVLKRIKKKMLDFIKTAYKYFQNIE